MAGHIGVAIAVAAIAEAQPVTDTSVPLHGRKSEEELEFASNSKCYNWALGTKIWSNINSKIIILDGLAATTWLVNPLNRRSYPLGAGSVDSRSHL